MGTTKNETMSGGQAAWLGTHGFEQRGGVFELCLVSAERYAGQAVRVDRDGWLLVGERGAAKHNGCTAERITIGFSTAGHGAPRWTVTRVSRMLGRAKSFATKRAACEYAADRARFALERGGYRRVERS